MLYRRMVSHGGTRRRCDETPMTEMSLNVQALIRHSPNYMIMFTHELLDRVVIGGMIPREYSRRFQAFRSNVWCRGVEAKVSLLYLPGELIISHFKDSHAATHGSYDSTE